MAYKVEVNEKLRAQIGVATYNEYVRDMEEKYGKEKAAEIINEPAEKLKNIQAFQTVWRVLNVKHPKGIPKTPEDMAGWTHVDKVRLELGEKDFMQHLQILIAEFGVMKADKLLGIQEDILHVQQAMGRLREMWKGEEKLAQREKPWEEHFKTAREIAVKKIGISAEAFEEIYTNPADQQVTPEFLEKLKASKSLKELLRNEQAAGPNIWKDSVPDEVKAK